MIGRVLKAAGYQVLYAVVFAMAGAVFVPARAQVLPVGTLVLEDYYRRQQLNGHTDSNISFLIRPLTATALRTRHLFTPDSGANPPVRSLLGYPLSDSGKLSVVFVPLRWTNQVNSRLPYGWNDGALNPAKGYQTVASAGFYLKYGPVSLQLQPELTYARNRDWEGFPVDLYLPFYLGRYSDYYSNISDLPEHFGQGSYGKLALAQSHLGVTVGAVKVALSNENLWWGPGTRNALLMSNTAKGFQHISVSTARPLLTRIGSFEGQFIAGRLEDSGYPAALAESQLYGSSLYQQRNTSWRYLSGAILTWQPKWTPGLFLGYARTAQGYHDAVKGLEFFPPALLFSRLMGSRADQLRRDEYSALSARWLLTAAKGEIYFEYGRNNHMYDETGYPVSSAGSAAYTLGLRKLIQLAHPESHVQVGLEVTQLGSRAEPRKVGEPWYVHSTIRQGYTHKGNLLGAGIGSGGQLQSLSVGWFRNLKGINLQLERQVHNNDLYYHLFTTSLDPRRHWVDLSAAASAHWNFGKVILNGNFTYVSVLNYQYYLDDTPPGNDYTQYEFWVKGKDLKNIHASLSVLYRF